MPFKPVENPKCPKCGKSVYAAEERVAGGLKWHKMCFKCGLCGKLLDSTNCSEHEGELFCKVCHARKFGPKGYGFGGGAGCLSMDTGSHLGGELNNHYSQAVLETKNHAKAPEGEGCPRCGGYVYAAEQMLARGRPWHKSCFKCADCSKRLDSVNCCEGPDKEIYCKVCYGKKFGPKGYGYGQGGGALQSDCYANGDSAPKTTVIDTAIIKAKPGQGCPRCGGVVFAAEQVLAKSREWHRKCFKCRDCTKTLDSIIACDGPDKDVYCKTCYGKKWGPHGYGFACGSGFLQTDGLTEDEISSSRPFYNPDTTSIKAPAGQGCPRCGGAVFAAEQQLAKGTMWHKKCFNCAECHRPLDSMLACDGPDKEIHCRACYGKLFGPKGFGYGHAPTLVSTDGESQAIYEQPQAPKTTVLDTAIIKPESGPGCPRCGGAVFAAELVLTKGREWHRKCFKCKNCSKTLDSVLHCDGPDKDIYCKTCYGKKWGPQGFGFAGGRGFLQCEEYAEGEPIPKPFINPDTTSIKAPEGEGCPRCGGVVFAAEQELSKGKMWHRRCFTCAECHRPLDSMLACDGPDKEIHCKLCYAKLFGPKGFGYGHAPTLVSTDDIQPSEENDAAPKTTVIDTAVIKAEPGQGCPRCGGAVFAAEQVLTKGQIWHIKCFKCHSCNKTLDSVIACDGPDKDVYCKTCYGKRWGPQGFGFAGGRGFLQCEEYADGEPIPKPFINPNTTSIKAPEGEGCPGCGGAVFAAEQVFSKGRIWHQQCFKCNKCRVFLDAYLACDGPDKTVYCKTCYAKKWGPQGYGFAGGRGFLQCDEVGDGDPVPQPFFNPNTTSIKAPEGEGCPRCGGVVFAAEQELSKGKMWHRKCFNCAECHRPLDSVLACDGPDKEIHCKLCYAKIFGPKGFGYGHAPTLVCIDDADRKETTDIPKIVVVDPSVIKAEPGQGCPSCGGAVFAAEQVFSKGRVWHQQCFKCRKCRCYLDAYLACDGPDKTVYCKTCYAKKWGPQGYGFAGGRGFLQCDEVGDGDPVPQPFFNPNTTSIKAPEGEGCPRCGGMVFAAEQQLSKGKMWHQKCFNCAECHRPLDSVLACDGPDKEIHCKLCYAKIFGPKGFGYGHAPTLVCVDDADRKEETDIPKIVVVDPSVIKAEPGQGCPSCGGAVFAAEQVFSKGRVWHQQCFKCRKCRCYLDAYLACDGPDKTVYCKTCYAKKWGPQGYGFAGGRGFLQCDETGDGEPNLKPFINPDTTTIKAPEGQGCPRCGGVVFAAEQQMSKGTMWHKKCFNCAECHRPLDSMLACDGPDKDIHCKLCYAKNFGPKGFGYGHAPTLVTIDGLRNPDEVEHAQRPADDTTIIKAEPGQGCPRCGGMVFAAEQVLAKGRAWHQKCFKCRDCSKNLDSVIACDGPDKDVYCKTCYGKKWGPQGYGFAGGRGFLQSEGLADGEPTMKPFITPDTTTIQAPAGEGCPRCGGKVFAAEQQLSRGTMWHKKCFTCAECHRPLDSMSLCDGPDKEIHCSSCYNKRFGSRGVSTITATANIESEAILTAEQMRQAEEQIKLQVSERIAQLEQTADVEKSQLMQRQVQQAEHVEKSQEIQRSYQESQHVEHSAQVQQWQTQRTEVHETHHSEQHFEQSRQVTITQRIERREESGEVHVESKQYQQVEEKEDSQPIIEEEEDPEESQHSEEEEEEEEASEENVVVQEDNKEEDVEEVEEEEEEEED